MKRFLKSFVAVILVISMILPVMTVFAATSVPYNKTGIVYTVSGNSYYEAVTTADYNGVAKGTSFWLDSGNNIVINRDILAKLDRLERFNKYAYSAIYDGSKSAISTVESVLDTYIKIINHDKTCDIAGMIIGETVSVAVNAISGPIAWGSIALDIMVDGALISVSDAATVSVIQMFKVYSHNAISYAKEVLKYNGAKITDYETMVKLADYYSKVVANRRAAWDIAGEKISEISEMSEIEFFFSNFWKIFKSFGLSIFPGDTLAQIISSQIADGTVGFLDIFEASSSSDVYNNVYNEHFNTYSYNGCNGDDYYYDAIKLSSGNSNNNESSSYKTGLYTPEFSDGLNVRSSASTTGNVVTAIPYGKTFNVTKVSGNWGYTTYNGKNGWACLDYAVPSSNTGTNTTTDDPIISYMKTTYDSALKSAKMDDFDGWCGECVGQQLKVLGVNTGAKITPNGNDTYDKYKSMSKTSGGYSVVKYPSGSYSMKQALESIDNLGGYTYAVLGFETGSSSANGQKYGHTLLIYAVRDGYVYYTECFIPSSESNPWVKRSIDKFCSAYSDNKSTSAIEYKYEGMILFDKDGNSDNFTSSEDQGSSVVNAEISEGTYIINSKVNSYRYLTAKTDSNGGQVQGKPFEDTDAQKFEIVECNNGYQFICKASSSGRVVNVYRDGTSQNGDNVTLWSSTKNGTQVWTLEKHEDAYVIHPSDNSKLALTAQDTGRITVNTYTGASNQLWIITQETEKETEPKMFIVTYSTGCSTVIENQNKAEGQSLNITNIVPEKKGYIFKGWATSSTGSVKYNSGDAYTTDANLTLYAVWEKIPEEYTIVYVADGAKNTPANQTKIEKVALTLSSTIPEKEGYIFKGWATSSTGSVKYNSGDAYTTDADLKLYAVWEEEKSEAFYVFYNGNGGYNTPDMQTKMKGEDIKLSANIPGKDGNTFKGWATSVEGKAVYKAGDTYTEDKTIYLFAVWEPDKYTVSYSANGGDGAPSNSEKTHGVTLILSSVKPVKEGYKFLGWSENRNSETVDYTSGDLFFKEEDTVLYAVWEEVESKFEFADVPEDAWYKEDVEKAYENGFVNGKGESRYAPEDNMTYAEAIKIACTIYQYHFEGEVTLVNGDDVWYSTFMEYALKNRIVRSDYSSVANNKITRRDFVNIFYGALPLSEFGAINKVADNAIPDVKLDDAYSTEIYTFYRAGILTGSDSKCSFMPESNIKRSEVAAIITRMIDSGARKNITLK